MKKQEVIEKKKILIHHDAHSHAVDNDDDDDDDDEREVVLLDNNNRGTKRRIGGVIVGKDKDRGKNKEDENTTPTTNTFNVEFIFNDAKLKLNEAQVQLEAAQEHMMQVRKRIRSNGFAEPDSLLYLSYATSSTSTYTKNINDHDQDNDHDKKTSQIKKYNSSNNNNNNNNKSKNYVTESWAMISALQESNGENNIVAKCHMMSSLKHWEDNVADVDDDDTCCYNDHLLTYIFDYFDFKDASICSMVCKRFHRNMNTNYWPKIDQKLNLLPLRVELGLADSLLRNSATIDRRRSALSSPSAKKPMERVIRYHNASKEAERIASLGELISKHEYVTRYSRGSYDDEVETYFNRVRNECKGCDGVFPEQLNFDMFGRNSQSDDYELFVRFSRTNDNFLFAEGFLSAYDLPFVGGQEGGIDGYPDGEENISIDHIDFTKWQKMVDITQSIAEGRTSSQETKEQQEECDIVEKNILDCLKELTVTVVAVHKISYKASLVLAQSDISHGDLCLGGHGFCSTKNKCLVHSHGPIKTKLKYNNISNRMEKDCVDYSGQLGMYYTNYTYPDSNNKDKDRSTVCVWSLHLDVDVFVVDMNNNSDNDDGY